jgi:hypothetical protein
VETPKQPSTVFLCRDWFLRDSEVSFVTRSLAGASSRRGELTVIAPSQPGPTLADGAFDVVGIGASPDGTWPQPSRMTWPDFISESAIIVADRVDASAEALVGAVSTEGKLFAVLPPEPSGDQSRFTQLKLASSVGSDIDFIGMHVPINPLAATHRHNGLGFTGYILALTDRATESPTAPPTSNVAWLTARFPTLDIVVVENAAAAVWRGRALRGVVPVNTRTDLWRLLAHARMVIDLSPGPVIARECLEALRFAVPIVVPEQSVAGVYATAGGGFTFSNVASLFSSVDHLLDDTERSLYASQGKAFADAHYGDSAAFVERVATVLVGGIG